MDEPTTPTLEDHEKLALCGLMHLLLRADRQVTSGEREMVHAVLAEVFCAPVRVASAPVAPYREAAVVVEDEVDVAGWMDRAGRALPDDEAIRQAARAVLRPEARQLLFDALFSVAAADVVSPAEWPLLDWLASTWSLPRPGA